MHNEQGEHQPVQSGAGAGDASHCERPTAGGAPACALADAKRLSVQDRRPPLLAPMRPHKMQRGRRWACRDKVSACLVANFPWEIVFKHLMWHPRSLILMQMVDKNLSHAIRSNDALWRSVFRSHVYRTAHAVVEVRQIAYPGLRLYKCGVTGVAVHMGCIRGDPDDHALPFGFDAVFSAYVRKAFALLYGQRCGLCGCRWHHEPYWSLGMRVCRLCVSGNVVSGWELFDTYGVHFYDIIKQIGGRVFYFMQQCGVGQDKTPAFRVRPIDLIQKMSVWVFWRPHLEKCLDLPALYKQQQAKRSAALLLCAVVRRSRVLGLRREFGYYGRHGRRSFDCLMMALYKEERRREVAQDASRLSLSTYVPGGGDWAFNGTGRLGRSRHEHFHRESKYVLATALFRHEDWGPALGVVGGGSVGGI